MPASHDPLDPGADIVVRPFAPGDLDAFVDIYLDLAAHHERLDADRYRVPDRDAVRARFGARLHEDDVGLHLVAERDGRVIGTLDAWPEGVPGPGGTRRQLRAARIGIAVAEDARGQGAGTRLMAAAEAWAVDRGLDELLLDVAAHNAGARRLYERLGYAVVEHEMAKPLRRANPGVPSRIG